MPKGRDVLILALATLLGGCLFEGSCARDLLSKHHHHKSSPPLLDNLFGPAQVAALNERIAKSRADKAWASTSHGAASAQGPQAQSYDAHEEAGAATTHTLQGHAVPVAQGGSQEWDIHSLVDTAFAMAERARVDADTTHDAQVDAAQGDDMMADYAEAGATGRAPSAPMEVDPGKGDNPMDAGSRSADAPVDRLDSRLEPSEDRFDGQQVLGHGLSARRGGHNSEGDRSLDAITLEHAGDAFDKVNRTVDALEQELLARVDELERAVRVLQLDNKDLRRSVHVLWEELKERGTWPANRIEEAGIRPVSGHQASAAAVRSRLGTLQVRPGSTPSHSGALTPAKPIPEWKSPADWDFQSCVCMRLPGAINGSSSAIHTAINGSDKVTSVMGSAAADIFRQMFPSFLKDAVQCHYPFYDAFSKPLQALTGPLPSGLQDAPSYYMTAFSKQPDLPAEYQRRDVAVIRPCSKTCAVVGTSPALLRAKRGAEIDAHDLVIRPNIAPVAGFEDYVGSRTSVRVFYPESYDPRADIYERRPEGSARRRKLLGSDADILDGSKKRRKKQQQEETENNERSRGNEALVSTDIDEPPVVHALVAFKRQDLSWGVKALQRGQRRDLYRHPPHVWSRPHGAPAANFTRITAPILEGPFALVHPYLVRAVQQNWLHEQISGRWWPSTGLIAVIVASMLCEEVHAYGFSSMNDVGSGYGHYYEKKVYSTTQLTQWKHNFQSEWRALDLLGVRV
eukprot:jgi/Mesvir1/14126/Mv12416-RA.1